MKRIVERVALIRCERTHQHHPLCALHFWRDETGQRKKRKLWSVLVRHEEDPLLELVEKGCPLQNPRDVSQQKPRQRKMEENKVKKRESGQGVSRDGRVHSCRMSAGSRGSSRQRQIREVIARGNHEARKEVERHEREMTWRQMPRTIEDNICTFGPNALDSWAFSRSQDLIVSASSR